MGKHVAIVEVDTSRDEYGDSWGANHDMSKVPDEDVPRFLETLGAGPGAQWDVVPFSRVLSVVRVHGGEFNPSDTLKGLAEEVGYDELEDVPVDTLIDYKNALEDRCIDLEARLARVRAES